MRDFSCILLLLIILSLCSILTNVDGFEPLIQQLLPRLKRLRTTTRVVSVIDYGAIGDGYNDDTQAFKDAWKEACSFPSRAILEIPKGYTYLVRPIDFAGPCQSRLTLKISGTITAPKDPGVWHGLNPRKWIYFHAVNHLTVEGGVINGMGEEWWRRSCKVNFTNPCTHAPTVRATMFFQLLVGFSNNDYAQAMTFHKCKYLLVKNMTVIHSQQMHMAFTNCNRVKASHLKVIAPIWSPNTDAIHISASSSVEVENIIIETGDDCISIVSNSSKIRIRDISCRSGHGISIGSLGKYDSWAAVHDVLVDRVFLSNTENGVRIKTWQGGSGIAKMITFQNVFMQNVSNPIIIDQYYCDSQLPCANETSAVKVRDISFVGIKGTSATEEAIRFACSDSSPCEGLYLENIQLLSYNGGDTTAFCWESKGSSSGQVYPLPCFSCSGGNFIKQKTLPHHDQHASSK